MGCAAAEELGRTPRLCYRFWDPSRSSSDPSLTGRDECTAAGHLASVIMVFAHHPEGDAYGAIAVLEALESLALLSSWGDWAQPNGPCDHGIAFCEPNVPCGALRSRSFEDSTTIRYVLGVSDS